MVLGVTEGYEKKMEIHGTGYRVANKGGNLEFALGYSHPITVEHLQGILGCAENPTRFSVQGIDKQAGWRGCREHPQAPASPTRTRARACGMRASRSAARSERLGK